MVPILMVFLSRINLSLLVIYSMILLQLFQVHGIIRRSSSFNTGRIDSIYRDRHETGVKIFLHYGDLCDATNLINIISKVRPSEIYNLGAMSHVKVSFDMPEYTADCDGVGVLRMLDAIRACGMEKEVRFYQASTSELYGKVREVPQSETTPFYPRSPYAGTYKAPKLLIKKYSPILTPTTLIDSSVPPSTWCFVPQLPSNTPTGYL